MPSFKIDLSTAVVFVATAPVPKLANVKTGERAMDRETGAPLSTVGLLVSDEGEGNLYQERSELRILPTSPAYTATY
jgi:hypothetical protein